MLVFLACVGVPPGCGEEVGDLATAELVFVRGTVTPTDGRFLPFYRIPVTPENLASLARQPTAGSHSVQFVDAAGHVADEIAWTPTFERTDASSERVGFSWLAVPTEGVAEVRLTISGRIVAVVEVDARQPRVEDLSLQRPADDSGSATMQVSWRVEEMVDAASLLHQIYYSADGGRSWILVKSGLTEPSATIDLTKLPGSPESLLRISTTDGYNASQLISEPFKVADKPPTCARTAPRPGSAYLKGAGVLLIGRCVDLEDGAIPPEWYSDLQGFLGTGDKLVVRDLIVGNHQITVRSRDTRGNEAHSQPFAVEIKPR